ncbi:MAG: hypothetical protein ACYDH5_13915, partial [Acidimicrobiales bacterium]
MSQHRVSQHRVSQRAQDQRIVDHEAVADGGAAAARRSAAAGTRLIGLLSRLLLGGALAGLPVGSAVGGAVNGAASALAGSSGSQTPAATSGPASQSSGSQSSDPPPQLVLSSPTEGQQLSSEPFAATGQVTASGSGQLHALQVTLYRGAGQVWSTSQPLSGSHALFHVSVPAASNGTYRLVTVAVETFPVLPAPLGTSAPLSGLTSGTPLAPSSSRATSAVDVAVAVPAAVPQGLHSSVSTSPAAVVLAWQQVQASGLAGYEVQRQVSSNGQQPAGGSPWVEVAGATQAPASTHPSFRDSSVANGVTYLYRVISLRQGASSSGVVASAPSGVLRVLVPALPARSGVGTAVPGSVLSAVPASGLPRAGSLVSGSTTAAVGVFGHLLGTLAGFAPAVPSPNSGFGGIGTAGPGVAGGSSGGPGQPTSLSPVVGSPGGASGATSPGSPSAARLAGAV